MLFLLETVAIRLMGISMPKYTSRILAKKRGCAQFARNRSAEGGFKEEGIQQCPCCCIRAWGRFVIPCMCILPVTQKKHCFEIQDHMGLKLNCKITMVSECEWALVTHMYTIYIRTEWEILFLLLRLPAMLQNT